MCVQIALKQAAVVAVGRATITGSPLGSWADTAWPTGMSLSVASLLLEPADPLELPPELCGLGLVAVVV
jgi:hypothetical protein